MIYDVDKVDLMAERNDDGLDMFIISSGAIDDSPDTQKLLLDKVDKYLGYVNSNEFVLEFPRVKKEKITIVFELEEQAPKLLLELCEKIVPWVEDNGVRFVITSQK